MANNADKQEESKTTKTQPGPVATPPPPPTQPAAATAVSHVAATEAASPAPSGPEPLPKRVQALYDCEGDEDDELSFCSGEIIQVTDREDDDWWIGNIEAHPHRKGCFPVIFVTKLVD